MSEPRLTVWDLQDHFRTQKFYKSYTRILSKLIHFLTEKHRGTGKIPTDLSV